MQESKPPNPSRRTGPPARSGFTVLELIVLVAVVAILAAYLFPVFGRARENSQRRNCQTNLRHVALAFQAYLLDDDAVLPLLRGNGRAGSDRYGWAGALAPYLRHHYYLHCPDDPNRQTPATDGADYSNYFFNANLGGMPRRALKVPAHTIMNGDNAAGDATNNTDGGRTPDAPAALSSNSTLHLLGANYALADGHVAWLRPIAIKSGATPPAHATATFGP